VRVSRVRASITRFIITQDALAGDKRRESARAREITRESRRARSGQTRRLATRDTFPRRYSSRLSAIINPHPRGRQEALEAGFRESRSPELELIRSDGFAAFRPSRIGDQVDLSSRN